MSHYSSAYEHDEKLLRQKREREEKKRKQELQQRAIKMDANDDLTVAYMFGYRDGKRSKSSIAQSIREAAVSGKVDGMGYIEHDICTAFSNEDDWVHWTSPCYFQNENGLQHHARTFMLFVAEALE